MMRDGEVFVHILPQNTQPPAAGAKPPATPARASAPAAKPPASRAAATAPKPPANSANNATTRH
jgi:cell division protein FtsB